MIKQLPCIIIYRLFTFPTEMTSDGNNLKFPIFRYLYLYWYCVIRVPTWEISHSTDRPRMSYKNITSSDSFSGMIFESCKTLIKLLYRVIILTVNTPYLKKYFFFTILMVFSLLSLLIFLINLLYVLNLIFLSRILL